MKKYYEYYDRKTGKTIKKEITFLDKIKDLLSSVDWEIFTLKIVGLISILLLIGCFLLLFYMLSPQYCEKRALATGINDFKYIFPGNCLVKVPDLGWFNIEDYLKILKLH